MPSAPTPGSSIQVAPTEQGCCVRVEGRGTMHESAAARDLALRVLGEWGARGSAVVVFDLTDCHYLDSTFLGCLVELYRMYGRAQPVRFRVAGPPERRKVLLGPTRLDAFIPATDAPPAVCGPWVALPPLTAKGQDKDLLRHVMQCHRALAEVDSPMRAAFARIADQMEQEIRRA